MPVSDDPYRDHAGLGDEAEERVVRPYMLTRGRTRSSAVEVRMESLVDRRATADVAVHALGRTERDIWEVLAERRSAAEISATLRLPLGVVCVLVGDLAGAGVVDVHRTASGGDAELVRRLIDGVRAL